jgi:hypothetical protein
MKEFLIWARISHTLSEGYVAVVSAVPLRGSQAPSASDVRSEIWASLPEAQDARDRLANSLEAEVVARGDQVLTVEKS